ncbi:MAG: radical SAM protein [Promethearchaeota archaeon]|nr:MAG: radical SAM protein [Candidatus Lokiarchaeota archaeon]
MIKVDEKSGIPLFGLDFIGILDRGTNLLEIKPITICNLRCKYCFVNAHFGDYKDLPSKEKQSKVNNFIVDVDYILKWLKYALDNKKCDDIEVHIAPYGEFFLYPRYLELIKGIRKFSQVKIISIQTNGTLLTETVVKDLERAGVSRLNISLNALNEDRAQKLSGIPNYNVKKLLAIFDTILKSQIDLLIAPIWFFKYNDEDIIEIIKLAKKYEEKGFTSPYPFLGIQNYLVYKSGRKFWKVEPRQFIHFYQKLSEMEKTYNTKLKLGPHDFGIHTTVPITPPVEVGAKISVTIICKGRSNVEYIGVLDEKWAVKVLSKVSLVPQQRVTVLVIKQKLKENLITANISSSF